MTKIQAKETNKLLLSLPRAEYARLTDKLDSVTLNRGDLLSDFGQSPRYVYFPANALLSIWVEVDSDKQFSVGLVGREGMGNAISALDAQSTLFRTRVLCEGEALRMKTKDFVNALRASEIIRKTVHKYVSRLTGDIAQNAGCSHLHLTEQRLARCLLLARARLSSNNFFLTHETLAQLLSCRRVGITNAASALKDRKLIEYSRGYITVLDLNGLLEAACSCYKERSDGSHST